MKLKQHTSKCTHLPLSIRYRGRNAIDKRIWREAYTDSHTKYRCYSKAVKTLLENQSCAANHLWSCYCVTTVKISKDKLDIQPADLGKPKLLHRPTNLVLPYKGLFSVSQPWQHVRITWGSLKTMHGPQPRDRFYGYEKHQTLGFLTAVQVILTYSQTSVLSPNNDGWQG